MENKNDMFNKVPKNNKPKMFKFNLYWMYGLIFMMLIALYLTNDSSASKELGWTEFQKLAQDNVFDKMAVYNKKNLVEATVKSGKKALVFKSDSTTLGTNPKVYVKIPSADKFSDFYDKAVTENHIDTQVRYEEGDDAIWNFLVSFGPIILIIVVWIFLMRRMSGGAGGGPGGVFSVGKAKAQLFDKDNDRKVTFKDVAGLSEAKQEVEEIVAFLKNPEKYTELGGKIPKGALLVGPPGTGKTLLAKAVAGEADVPFFSLSGSDFVEMFVGVGASRVRDLFRQAKEKSPCIVFIDEIDAVGRARGKNANMNSNDERENTLNQLLTEMDGFGSNSGVIILAATNRADILDKALLRAGRFDRQISVELPDLNERKEIFGVHLRPIKIDESVDAEFMARQTPGFSGADIANVCNEAALIAARGGKKFVQKDDFMNAVDRIVGGLEKRTMITTADERKSIAYHEAGHATLSWFLEHANPLVKVTIVPRGKALGAAWYMPEERQITTREQMLDEMCATLGGRAADEFFLGKITTGASNDLERVTKQAYAMVVYFGMSEKLPNLNYYDSSGQDWGFTKPYSEETSRMIDQEVQRIITEQYERAKKILSDHAEGHNKLAQVLLEREVIYTEDVEHIFGKRAWISRSQEILDLQEKANNDKQVAAEETKTDETTPQSSDYKVRAVPAGTNETDNLA
ncbi:ATP-dependent zinc metalloprotease FtsH [Parabacteroides goldsteinii]|uniref:ATP-dependent zinc metalloprotease FtsH n=1 Tax=Parabacteroides TaxID=375288 RepID=UPI001CCC0A0C|nr:MULTISPECIES: ATP-dependent zinc metalloprotease FtsH [Parabacteroides]MCM0722064.1 ATP-dependent zinc metalloprotease FtsH [Parabacteroides sp. W1-Q-101]GKG76015.1 ATP-dependent zinc metalloprotease FtsH [Parabacteroides goldsteinii]GKG80577.1 ATP-dependent zinc metalloprotease FtsH [Parabacteroides goldsteinii]